MYMAIQMMRMISGEEDACDQSNRKVEESCRPVNPILH